MISTLSDFFEMGKSFIAFFLSNKGEIPVFKIFNPNYSICLWKNLHFDHLTVKLYSSNVDKVY